jgi:hypothetical protein
MTESQWPGTPVQKNITADAVDATDLAWFGPSAHTAVVAEPDGAAKAHIRPRGGKWSAPLPVRPPRFETPGRLSLMFCTGWCSACGSASTWRAAPAPASNAAVTQWYCTRCSRPRPAHSARNVSTPSEPPDPAPPAEPTPSDCVGVSYASEAGLKERVHSSGLGLSAESPLHYIDEGQAPPGSLCTICGQGTDDVRRIRSGGRVNPWHRDCADRHFAGHATAQTSEAPSP